MPFRSSLLHSAILASLPRPIIDLFLAHRRPTAASFPSALAAFFERDDIPRTGRRRANSQRPSDD